MLILGSKITTRNTHLCRGEPGDEVKLLQLLYLSVHVTVGLEGFTYNVGRLVGFVVDVF